MPPDTDQKPETRIALSANLDLSAAAPLARSLLAERGADLVVDAENVERIGAQCLQVLMAADKTWRADEKSFALVNVGEALSRALALADVDLPVESVPEAP